MKETVINNEFKTKKRDANPKGDAHRPCPIAFDRAEPGGGYAAHGAAARADLRGMALDDVRRPQPAGACVQYE